MILPKKPAFTLIIDEKVYGYRETDGRVVLLSNDLLQNLHQGDITLRFQRASVQVRVLSSAP